jgi:hypothetical protein
LSELLILGRHARYEGYGNFGGRHGGIGIRFELRGAGGWSWWRTRDGCSFGAAGE